MANRRCATAALTCVALGLHGCGSANYSAPPSSPAPTPCRNCKQHCVNGDCTCEPYGCRYGCPGYVGPVPSPQPTPVPPPSPAPTPHPPTPAPTPHPPTPAPTPHPPTPAPTSKCGQITDEGICDSSGPKFHIQCRWGGSSCLQTDGTFSCDKITDKDICGSSKPKFHIQCGWGGSSCLQTDGTFSCDKLTDKDICDSSKPKFRIQCGWGGSSCLPRYGGSLARGSMMNHTGHVAAMAPAVSDPLVVKVLQWSPHWECFEKSECMKQVEGSLTSWLSQHDIDFANIVELEDRTYKHRAPASWDMITSICGHGTKTDYTTLVYNKDRWTPVEGALKRGCMSTKPSDRSFVVQQFQGVDNGEQVIVIGAHFPHGTDFHVLGDAISSVMKSTGVSSVILIADTNQVSSSARIMEKLRIPHASESRSTDLLNTCCLNKPGFKFPYDRIVTNTPGSAVSTTVLLGWHHLPSWATGEFHKPLLGKFSFGSKSSGTAGTTTTPTINSSRPVTDTPSVTPVMV